MVDRYNGKSVNKYIGRYENKGTYLPIYVSTYLPIYCFTYPLLNLNVCYGKYTEDLPTSQSGDTLPHFPKGLPGKG